MILSDYHVHTLFSPDSKMEPEKAITSAISSGITEICFTEHMDLGHHMEAFNRIPDLQKIDKSILRLSQKYPCINIKKGIEVNTSGFKKAGHVLPHPSIIARYKELGGKIITIGSDAHFEKHVGLYIKETLDVLVKAGFREITLFSNRIANFVSII